MNRERVNDYINAYAKAINLEQSDILILKEVMAKMISKYEKITPYVSVEQDSYDKYIIKPQNGKYSMEDFLLNRLMRSVWNMKYDDKLDATGRYDTESLTIIYNDEKLDSQFNMFKKYANMNFEEFKSTEIKKDKMHEWGHALQSVFNRGSLSVLDRARYRGIINEIRNVKGGRYRLETNSFDKIEEKSKGNKEESINSGVLVFFKSKQYGSQKDLRIFNEILNESEALEMAGAKTRARRSYNNGMYYNTKNPENNTTYIANYGELVKTLLGDQVSFEGMYLNPAKMYIAMNKYNQVFQREYGNKDTAWINLLRQIRIIKETNSCEEQLKLNKVLCSCLKIGIEQTNPVIAQEKLDKYRKLTLNSDSQDVRKQMEHINILNSIQRTIHIKKGFGTNQIKENNDEFDR